MQMKAKEKQKIKKIKIFLLKTQRIWNKSQRFQKYIKNGDIDKSERFGWIK